MATIETEPKVRAKRALGGVAVEAFGAAGAVVLAIIGLAGLMPVQLAAVAAIAAGAALLFEGAAIQAELTPAHDVTTEDKKATAELGVEALAGLGAIVLGILTLANVTPPWTILPATAIVIGGGLVFASHPIVAVEPEVTATKEQRVVRGAHRGAAGVHAFAGVGAVVLGIIAFVVPAYLTLSLIAILVVGAALLLGGAAVGGRMARYLHA